jgi:two-component system LytT family response regulator
MKAAILDDESHCTSALKLLIEKYTDIEVIAIYNDPVSAIKQINAHQPDLLFLDIEMPYMNGFEFLNHFDEVPFNVIFTTAYDEYAIRAFRVRAVDYLLKPISKNDLIQAIAHAQELIGSAPLDKQFFEDVRFRINRVVVASLAGLELIETSAILYLVADSNYTRFALTSGSVVVSSKTLRTFEDNLKLHGFVRVHNSYLVNLSHIVRYVKGDGGYVVLTSGEHINVSRSRKDELMTLLQRMH